MDNIAMESLITGHLIQLQAFCLYVESVALNNVPPSRGDKSSLRPNHLSNVTHLFSFPWHA